MLIWTCFGEYWMVGVPKLLHQTSTPVSRPHFEVSQLLMVTKVVPDCIKPQQSTPVSRPHFEVSQLLMVTNTTFLGSNGFC